VSDHLGYCLCWDAESNIVMLMFAKLMVYWCGYHGVICVCHRLLVHDRLRLYVTGYNRAYDQRVLQ
jgi:hypothetical protein